MPDIFFIMHLIHASQQPGEGYIGLGLTGRIAHAEPGIKTLPVLPRPLRLRQLTDVLYKNKLIPTTVESAIRDILPIANRAVHGDEFSTETTLSTIRVGKEVINYLYSLSSQNNKQ